VIGFSVLQAGFKESAVIMLILRHSKCRSSI